MRFAYYEQLSRRDQATYRKSDRLAAVTLDDPEALVPPVEALGVALEADDRRAVQRACQGLLDGTTRQLGTAPVRVRVLQVRPSSAEAELHGQYDPAEDGPARITVWMRTAAHQRVVRFRTFVRTLLHELCHHLDYVLFGLDDSFHTEGFFRRESGLVRALIDETARSQAAVELAADAAGQEPASASRPPERMAEQLELPF